MNTFLEYASGIINIVPNLAEAFQVIGDLSDNFSKYIFGDPLLYNKELNSLLESSLYSLTKFKDSDKKTQLFKDLMFEKNSHNYTIYHEEKGIVLQLNKLPSISFKKDCSIDNIKGTIAIELRDINNNGECTVELSFMPQDGINAMRIMHLNVDNDKIPTSLKWFKKFSEYASHLDKQSFVKLEKIMTNKQDEKEIIELLFISLKEIIIQIINNNPNVKKEMMIIKLKEVLKNSDNSFRAIKKS